MTDITTTPVIPTMSVELTTDEIHELIDVLVWANQKTGGRKTAPHSDGRPGVATAWDKLAAAGNRPATDEPREGSHYDRDVLIDRAIKEYDGETGGDKDYRAIGAVLPDNCKVTAEDGKLYVRLFARNVQTGGLVAEYEVVEHEPDLVNTHRADAGSAGGGPA